MQSINCRHSFYNFAVMRENTHRTEKDLIGSLEIPKNALYGIHSIRAKENFPDQTPFHIEWYSALCAVKKACYQTAKEFFEKASERIETKNIHFNIISEEIFNAMISTTEEMESGKYYEFFIAPAISGGAGTSINLNINEIIANCSLKVIGKNPGDYQLIDPIEHANIFQSTNDVVPTSLKVATIQLLTKLEEKINDLRLDIEKLEKKHANHLRKGYTQMQEAVPSSFGRLFSTYSDALSRDWWRISKCFERIKVVNLGGSAIGSGITVPKYFIMEVVRKLQKNTGLPITRGENLYDATSNLDAFVEVHGIIKAHAVNLEKMVSDLRLLSSDINSNKELHIPAKQTGSSIMPGKVNPVIPEFVISCAHKIYANDSLIATLSAQGCLELNAYIPIIGHCLLESIKLLIACNKTITENLITGLTIDHNIASEELSKSPSITTALVPYIGYNKASELAKYMKSKNLNVFDANKELSYVNEEKLIDLLQPQNLLKEGFSLKDISDFNS